jgi:dipeptidyl aminopeptidase/acylaminoacyl peptidase
MKYTPAISRINRRRSFPRLLGWILAALLLLALLGCAGISTYVGWQLTHPKRDLLTDSPANYNADFDKIRFDSHTGDVELQGWFIPGLDAAGNVTISDPASDRTIIFAHGYRKNRLQDDAKALPLALAFVKQGYNVLMLDFRNSGESGGKLTSVGYLEKQDLLGAIDWVKTNRPGRIGIVGFSMGATTALMAAAEDPAVSAVVADSPFNHLTRYLKANLPVWSKLPNIPFTPLILSILPPVTGIDPDAVDALRAVDSIYPRPILFIHSTKDPSIPIANSESLQAKHPDRFELWRTDNEGHSRSHALIGVEYEQRVLAFFDRMK